MSKIKFNPINDRIINEILEGKKNINYAKEIVKDDENLSGSFNKLVGNLTAMTLRKYISNIINYHGLNYKVSNTNAFVKGCPIEWDLIILKSTAEDINNTNVFNVDDCVCLLEFKTSGLMTNQYKHIDETFKNQFNYLHLFRKQTQKSIPFGYITFAESIEYYTGTKNFFDKQNNLHNTVFAFLDYDNLARDNKKVYIEECNDFEDYLYNLFNQCKDNNEQNKV